MKFNAENLISYESQCSFLKRSGASAWMSATTYQPDNNIRKQFDGVSCGAVVLL